MSTPGAALQIPTSRDLPCRPWLGRSSEYQGEAADVLSDRLAAIYAHETPWVYVAPTCGTKMCLQELHLRHYRAQKIAYPSHVCVYCGLPGYTKDHLLPATMTGEAVRKFVAVVPACHECNSGIGDRCGYRITERREEAHRLIKKKHRKTLAVGRQWTADDLDELGPNLRAHIESALDKRDVLLERLAWPHDPEYDKRAFQKSGIEDPYAMGLI